MAIFETTYPDSIIEDDTLTVDNFFDSDGDLLFLQRTEKDGSKWTHSSFIYLNRQSVRALRDQLNRVLGD